MTERTVSVSCEADRHDRCGGKTQWFKDKARRWTQQKVRCACACHEVAAHVVRTYTSRAGERIYVMSDGSTSSTSTHSRASDQHEQVSR